MIFEATNCTQLIMVAGSCYSSEFLTVTRHQTLLYARPTMHTCLISSLLRTYFGLRLINLQRG